MRPMAPDKPGNSEQQQSADYCVKTMEVLAERVPVLAKLHADISKAETPRPGTQKCIEVKSSLRHLGNSSRKSDKSPNHRQQPGYEHGRAAVARKKTLRDVQIPFAKQNVRSPLFYQRTSAVIADPIRNP